jgi:hypothetical protein
MSVLAVDLSDTKGDVTAASVSHPQAAGDRPSEQI